MPKRTSEIERIKRWRRLLRLLADGDPACRSRELLTEKLEISGATLGRDLADLEELGATIEYRRDKGYRLVESFDPLVQSLSTEQAMALSFLAQSGVNFASTPIAKGARGLVDSIEKAFMVDQGNSHGWVRRSVRFTDMAKPQIEQGVWEPIARAFSLKQQVRFLYESPGNGGQKAYRSLSPWAIIVSSGVWFLYGKPRGDGKGPQTFHFGRIKKAEVSAQAAEVPPEGWSLDDYVAKGFGGLQSDGVAPTRYRLRFSALVASRARERRWPEGALETPQPDGSLVVTFEASYGDWVQREIASWRSEVEVLGPEE